MTTKTLPDTHYRCVICHGTFVKAVSDEAALNEAMGLWGARPPEAFEKACDPCYRKTFGDDA